jgi:hypothetical protein
VAVYALVIGIASPNLCSGEVTEPVIRIFVYVKFHFGIVPLCESLSTKKAPIKGPFSFFVEEIRTCSERRPSPDSLGPTH